MNSICVPVVTPGHCGSSLMLQILEDLGFYSPAGGNSDPRHPCGYHDEMEIIEPQQKGDWNWYKLEVEKRTSEHSRWAFKFQTAIQWGPKAFDILPNPHIILYDREDIEKVRRVLNGHHLPDGTHRNWADWFYENLDDALAGRPYLHITFESILRDKHHVLDRLCRYLYDGDLSTIVNPDLVKLALSRVQPR